MRSRTDSMSPVRENAAMIASPFASASASSSRCTSPATSESSLSDVPQEESSASPRGHRGSLRKDKSTKAKDGAFITNDSPSFGPRMTEDSASVQKGRDGKARSAAAAFTLVALYFTLNLALTFYNKSLLNSFPFPYLITAVHAASGIIGCCFVRLIKSDTSFGLWRLKSIRNELNQYEAATLLDTKEREAIDIEAQPSTISLTAVPKDQPTQSVRDVILRNVVILAYSALYAANIAISNASLSLVSVPFHQIIRSTCPLFTAALGFMLLAKRPTSKLLWPLIPVVLGAAFSCFGEVSFTSTGFLLTMLGTILAALKTVTTNLLQGGGSRSEAMSEQVDEEKGVRSGEGASPPSLTARQEVKYVRNALCYSPLELLRVMSPLACIQCLAVSAWTGELRRASEHFLANNNDSTLHQKVFNSRLALVLLGNGTMAFALNYVSFKTNRAAGPLAMTVVGNLKQVVTIVLAVWLYGVSLGGINATGIMVALCGTAWYGYEAYTAKQKRTQSQEKR